MLESLAAIDRLVFLFINVHLANPGTDVIMPLITSDTFLRILYGAGIAVLLWRGDKKARWYVLVSLVVLLATDQLASNLLKGIFARPRPCHVLFAVHLLVNCGAGYSMPSSHAANVFGQAVLFSLLFRQLRWYLFSFAALVALSRVFVGVHYPSDILVGAILGAIIGYGGATASRYFLFSKRREDKNGISH